MSNEDFKELFNSDIEGLYIDKEKTNIEDGYDRASIYLILAYRALQKSLEAGNKDAQHRFDLIEDMIAPGKPYEVECKLIGIEPVE